MKAIEDNRIEITHFPDGRAVWLVRMADKCIVRRIVPDPDGLRALADARAWIEAYYPGVEFQLRESPAISNSASPKRARDGIMSDRNVADSEVMLQQLRESKGAVVELTPVKEAEANAHYWAYLLEHDRVGSVDPPRVLSAMLDVPHSIALLEAGGRWMGGRSSDPRK